MISRKIIDNMTFAELQSHIRNHIEELKAMESEAIRRAELVESKHEAPAILYLLEQAITWYRCDFKIKAHENLKLADEKLMEELSGDKLL